MNYAANIEKLEGLLHTMEDLLEGVDREASTILRESCERAEELVLDALAQLGAMARDSSCVSSSELASVVQTLDALADGVDGALGPEIDEGRQHEDGFVSWDDLREAACKLAHHIANDEVAGWRMELRDIVRAVRAVAARATKASEKLDALAENGCISDLAVDAKHNEDLREALGELAGLLVTAREDHCPGVSSALDGLKLA